MYLKFDDKRSAVVSCDVNVWQRVLKNAPRVVEFGTDDKGKKVFKVDRIGYELVDEVNKDIRFVRQVFDEKGRYDLVMLTGNVNEGALSVREDATEKEIAQRICSELKNAADDSNFELVVYIAFDQKTIPELNKMAEEYWYVLNIESKRMNAENSDYPLSPNFLMHDNKLWVYKQLNPDERAVAHDILLYDDDPEQEFPDDNYRRFYVLLKTSIRS